MISNIKSYLSQQIGRTDPVTNFHNARNITEASGDTISALRSGDTEAQVDKGKGLLKAAFDVGLFYVMPKPWTMAKAVYSGLELREAVLQQNMHLQDAESYPRTYTLDQQMQWRAEHMDKAAKMGPQILGLLGDTAVNTLDILPLSPGTSAKFLYQQMQNVKPETIDMFMSSGLGSQ